MRVRETERLGEKEKKEINSSLLFSFLIWPHGNAALLRCGAAVRKVNSQATDNNKNERRTRKKLTFPALASQ